jgi:hypothetical protein
MWLDELRALLLDWTSQLTLLLRTDPFWRTPADADWFHQRTPDGKWLRLPAREEKIPGRIAFYGGSATAPETHSWFTWRKMPCTNETWLAEMLPRLPADQLRWRVRPGTEDIQGSECPAGGGDHPQDEAADALPLSRGDARPDGSERRAGDHGGGGGSAVPSAPVERVEEVTGG